MVVVIGETGQVARALRPFIPGATFLPSSVCNLEKPNQLIPILETYSPQAIINAAAFTQVDLAETEREKALLVNATSPGLIARWCAEKNIPLVHYSTDYVFNGAGSKPWVETDKADPINWYGHTKHQGEDQIVNSGCNHWIFRISWVHFEGGKNFVETIRRLSLQKEELKIVDDQWGSPTHASDVARVTRYALDSQLGFGLYHLRFSPYTTWYKFACKIIDDLKAGGVSVVTKKIIPISSEEFSTVAKKPKNSRLGSIIKSDLTNPLGD